MAEKKNKEKIVREQLEEMLEELHAMLDQMQNYFGRKFPAMYKLMDKISEIMDLNGKGK